MRCTKRWEICTALVALQLWLAMSSGSVLRATVAKAILQQPENKACSACAHAWQAPHPPSPHLLKKKPVSM